MNPITTKLLGSEAEDLLSHQCKTIPKADLSLPGPDFVDRTMAVSDRPARVLRNLQALFNFGRLAGTGYFSILPVDSKFPQRKLHLQSYTLC